MTSSEDDSPADYLATGDQILWHRPWRWWPLREETARFVARHLTGGSATDVGTFSPRLARFSAPVGYWLHEQAVSVAVFERYRVVRRHVSAVDWVAGSLDPEDVVPACAMAEEQVSWYAEAQMLGDVLDEIGAVRMDALATNQPVRPEAVRCWLADCEAQTHLEREVGDHLRRLDGIELQVARYQQELAARHGAPSDEIDPQAPSALSAAGS